MRTRTHTHTHARTHAGGQKPPPYPTLPYPTLPYPTLPYPTLPLPYPYPTLPYPRFGKANNHHPTLHHPTLPYTTLPYPYPTLPYQKDGKAVTIYNHCTFHSIAKAVKDKKSNFVKVWWRGCEGFCSHEPPEIIYQDVGHMIAEVLKQGKTVVFTGAEEGSAVVTRSTTHRERLQRTALERINPKYRDAKYCALNAVAIAFGLLCARLTAVPASMVKSFKKSFAENYVKIKEAHIDGFLSMDKVRQMLAAANECLDFRQVLVPEGHRDESWAFRFDFVTKNERPADSVVYVACTHSLTHSVVIRNNEVFNPSNVGNGVLTMADAVSKGVISNGGINTIFEIFVKPPVAQGKRELRAEQRKQRLRWQQKRERKAEAATTKAKRDANGANGAGPPHSNGGMPGGPSGMGGPRMPGGGQTQQMRMPQMRVMQQMQQMRMQQMRTQQQVYMQQMQMQQQIQQQSWNMRNHMH
jgi:hypothetical protein